jgi:hypothetical protein
VVAGGGGDAPKKLGPTVEVAFGRVCSYGQHSRAGRVSKVNLATLHLLHFADCKCLLAR